MRGTLGVLWGRGVYPKGYIGVHGPRVGVRVGVMGFGVVFAERVEGFKKKLFSLFFLISIIYIYIY